MQYNWIYAIQLYSYNTTVFIQYNCTYTVQLYLYAVFFSAGLCLLGSFECTTSPFLLQLGLIFQLSLIVCHQIQHHRSWSSSCSPSIHISYSSCSYTTAIDNAIFPGFINDTNDNLTEHSMALSNCGDWRFLNSNYLEPLPSAPQA